VTQRLGTLGRRAISAIYLRVLRRRWGEFRRAAARPRRAQELRLRQLVAENAGSDFGRRHGFDRIASVEAFRSQVPVRDYEAYAPWIDRVARGEQRVLTVAPVRVMERSSGSTSVNKLIPYTDSLLDEFSAATSPWIYDLHRSLPALPGKTSYWSISPVARQRRTTSGGIPIGFEDDTEYFGPVQRWALAQLMAVPSRVARIPDLDEWRRVTCRHLLEAEDLGLISVWSPTFLTLLMEHIERNLDELLGEIDRRRAGRIRAAIAERGGRLTGDALWPGLAVVSSWADGSSGAFARELSRWFPATPIQPKGLLATEGVVSFPVWGSPGAVLAVAGHFLEFLDLERPDGAPLLADELCEGGSYSPLLTTGGGLYRYHLKDVVTCVGRYQGTPLVRFAGKLDAVSDLCGEKLNARHVEQALARARRIAGLDHRFALLAPGRGDRPRYVLYVDTGADDDALARAVEVVERHLETNHHYRYCRQLGQLGAVEAVRVERGWERYQAALQARGVRVGDVKPVTLDLKGAARDAFGAGTAPGDRQQAA
jgi:hypothetical protein